MAFPADTLLAAFSPILETFVDNSTILAILPASSFPLKTSLSQNRYLSHGSEAVEREGNAQ